MRVRNERWLLVSIVASAIATLGSLVVFSFADPGDLFRLLQLLGAAFSGYYTVLLLLIWRHRHRRRESAQGAR